MIADPRLTTRYALAKPAATHRRPATCEEVGCKYLRGGWQMRVMESTALGQRQVHLIQASGRRFVRIPQPDGGLYVFEAGQNCFGSHTVPVERPPIYIVRQGAQSPVRHVNGSDWVDDFASHLDKIREQ